MGLEFEERRRLCVVRRDDMRSGQQSGPGDPSTDTPANAHWQRTRGSTVDQV